MTLDLLVDISESIKVIYGMWDKVIHVQKIDVDIFHDMIQRLLDLVKQTTEMVD